MPLGGGTSGSAELAFQAAERVFVNIGEQVAVAVHRHHDRRVPQSVLDCLERDACGDEHGDMAVA